MFTSDKFLKFDRALNRSAYKAFCQLSPPPGYTPWNCQEARNYRFSNDSEIGKFYLRLYGGDGELLEAGRSLVRRLAWVTSRYPEFNAMCQAYQESQSYDPDDGAQELTPLAMEFAQIASSRRERWERLAWFLGEPAVPTELVLWRGVNNQRHDYVSDVIKAWKSGTSIDVRHNVLTSWSTQSGTAHAFAKRWGWGRHGAVVFRATIPFSDTIADKWLDDASFLVPWWTQDEVYVATSRPNSIVASMSDAVVWFAGKPYGYQNRAGLFSAWQDARR